MTVGLRVHGISMLPRAVTRVGLLATFDGPIYYLYIYLSLSTASNMMNILISLSAAKWCNITCKKYHI